MPMHNDMTPALDLTRDKGAGAVRLRHPVYADLLPPCNAACPAGENIQAWLDHAQAGRYREAWETLTRDNPMPAVHGRVCYHPCEDSCNRQHLDTAVSIHAVERYLGDRALAEGWVSPATAASSGKRVLVVGAGPSGLSAAYHLTRLGHQVVIHEAGPLAGGMLHFGIPAYRLPRDVLRAEIARIENMGVQILPGHKVADLLAEREAGRFDAVFIAIGAHLSRRIDLPAREAGRMLDAVSLLRDVETGQAPKLGRRVVIYGGGNTAMDAARTAKRLGAEEALIVYRRDRAHMPAHDFEAEEALAEGVKIKWLTTIKHFDGDALTVEVMALDEQGWPQPTDEYETLEADTVVMALGQETDSAFLRAVPGINFKRDGTVVVGPNMMTGHAGIFAGGDMVPGERSVTVAVGHGKKAARHIDAWMRGDAYAAPPKPPIVGFAQMALPIYSDAERSVQHERAAEVRVQDFREVVGGLDARAARFEARRCLSCGNCFECDNCYAACPEGAIIKLGTGKRYEVDLDRCTGCSTCCEQCPCHAITMAADAEPVA